MFSRFFSYMDGRLIIVAGYYVSSLEEIVETPLSRQNIRNDESSWTSEKAN